MASATLITPRDLDLLDALDRCPLTARQLLKLSATFVQPFTQERKVRARLQVLAESGRVKAFPYAVAGRGQPSYYTLTRQGFRMLHGTDVEPPGKRPFGPVAIAHQQHTFALAEFLVHLAVAAHRAGMRLTNFARENEVCLSSGDDRIYPDAPFSLEGQGPPLHFNLELDNGTERIRSPKEIASWEKKIRVYEAVQDRSASRFRVLAVSARRHGRIPHILGAAATLARDPRRSLVYGVALADFLALEEPLTTPCFLDHRGRSVSLVPPNWASQTPLVTAAPVCYAPAPALACRAV
jgi:hypothetical protein